jgi:hypothetical protein
MHPYYHHTCTCIHIIQRCRVNDIYSRHISYEEVKIISIPKGPVYWDKLGNDSSIQIQHGAGNVDVTNVHNLFHTIGIPVSDGLWLESSTIPTKKQTIRIKYILITMAKETEREEIKEGTHELEDEDKDE